MASNDITQQGTEIRGWPLAPPSWFFRRQLNPESYLPLRQVKFVGKIPSQTESKYVFLNIHILYKFIITMAQYMVKLYFVSAFLLILHTCTYCTDYQASWRAIEQVEIMTSLPPGQVLSEILCQPLHNITFNDVIGELYHAALNQNWNVVFIWSVDVCFIFTEQIIVIFMRPLYKAVILLTALIKDRSFCQRWNNKKWNKPYILNDKRPHQIFKTWLVKNQTWRIYEGICLIISRGW